MTRIIQLIIAIAVLAGSAAAQTDTTMTYQGILSDAGEPANGAFDLEFSLWDAASGGILIGVPHVLDDTPVEDGLFTVQIDFGADAFDNTACWLEITVNGTALSPRQPITRAPYAIQTRGLFVNEAGLIGVGTTSPISMLEVDSTEDAHGIRATVPWIPVWAHRASTTGSWPAIHGECDSEAANGTAIRGIMNSTSPGSGSAAVRGANRGTGAAGIGVWGSQDGSGYGVYGTVADDGIGVYGLHGSATGDEPGVKGRTNSTSMQSSGVFGIAAAGTGYTYGVWGRSYSTNGSGVTGRAMASTGIATGVFGQSDSTSGIGVSGWAANGSGVTYGGRFTAASANGTGVLGWHDSGNGRAPAVMGRTDSDDAYAVGVHGLVNTTAPGAFAAAIRGENLGTGGNGIGVWGSQNGSGWGVYGSAGAGGIGVYGSGGNYGVFSAGDVCTTGTYNTCSDARLKENIEPLSNALSMVLELRGVKFDWRSEEYPELNLSNTRQIGFIAQEVVNVLPELVSRSKVEGEYHTVGYDRVVPVLVEAIKELDTGHETVLATHRCEIDRLSDENSELLAENEALRTRIERLERLVDRIASTQEELTTCHASSRSSS